MALRTIRADLHIHTCLSPCADETMTPSAIVRQARRVGLELMGICDHNSCENASAVRRAGRREGLEVVVGLEITTREEIHIMGFFVDETAARVMQEKVYAHLPGENDPTAFGFQLVVDEDETITAMNDHLLIGATTLSLEQVVGSVHALGGLAIASHINREAFSIMSQLGFVPPGLELDAVEISPESKWKIPEGSVRTDMPLVTFSDAHYIDDIGKRVALLRIGSPTFSELQKALSGVDGRGVAG